MEPAQVSESYVARACRNLKSRRARILEIGYGSGVFMPELSARCDELYGVDVHSRHEEVAATILFLASPENRVTRGALVPVYGRSSK